MARAYGDSREWRGPTWGRNRQDPEVLSSLRDGWWRNATHLETLSATWPQSTDNTSSNPREELSFQIRLTNYGRLLREQAGSMLDRWQPGAPPADW